MLWAAAKAGHVLQDSKLQQLLGRLCAQLQDANPHDIASSVWAVAEMGKQMPDQQLLQLLAALCARLDQATPQTVANSLWACGRFRFLPTQLLTALEQQPEQRQRLMSAANGQDVANVALACGQLGFKGQLLMGALLHRAEQLQQQPGSAMAAQGCCNLSWAIAMLDMQQHAQHVLQLARACGRLWSSIVSLDMWQLYQVHLWLQDCQPQSNGLVGALTQQQLDQCRNRWEQSLAAQADTSKVSQFQQAVFEALERLPAATWRQPPAQEQPTADLAALIDIVAVTAAGVKLAIEADGPQHFVRPGNLLDGSTQHRNRLLKARGYTVVSIPHWEWQLTWTPNQQQAYLLSKLKGL